ncbi:hypothetical protein ADICEAN_04010 [Cesiribacter andamanensis AMV16]|uniref:Uncharacterized protein n=1 Tax=Cesiribacter andamanensis AMV16 TaxID=1279009 RepID=M7N0M9_9BACT|nr:hypothetical protein ADICEAN_04010 [Cesiribacter andamanensis AMV16]
MHIQAFDSPIRLRLQQLYKVGIALLLYLQFFTPLHYFFDAHGRLQVNLHALMGFEHFVLNGIDAPDGAVGRIHPDIEVVIGKVPPGPLRCDGAPQAILPGKLGVLSQGC